MSGDTVSHTFKRSPDVMAWTGRAAAAIAILLLAEFVVKMSEGARPELDDSAGLVAFITRTSTQSLIVILIDTVLMTCVIMFLAGFRQLITVSKPEVQWIADMAYGTGLIFVCVTLVGDAMQAGTSLDTVNMAADPSVLRALTVGHMLMFGSTGCVLLALVSAASGYVTLASGALPHWTGWVAYLVAILNVLAVPTMFGGTSDFSPFSAGGRGVAVFATFPWLVWVVAVGIVTIRGRRKPGLLAARG